MIYMVGHYWIYHITQVTWSFETASRAALGWLPLGMRAAGCLSRWDLHLHRLSDRIGQFGQIRKNLEHFFLRKGRQSLVGSQFEGRPGRPQMVKFLAFHPIRGVSKFYRPMSQSWPSKNFQSDSNWSNQPFLWWLMFYIYICIHMIPTRSHSRKIRISSSDI